MNTPLPWPGQLWVQRKTRKTRYFGTFQIAHREELKETSGRPRIESVRRRWIITTAPEGVAVKRKRKPGDHENTTVQAGAAVVSAENQESKMRWYIPKDVVRCTGRG